MPPGVRGTNDQRDGGRRGDPGDERRRERVQAQRCPARLLGRQLHRALRQAGEP